MTEFVKRQLKGPTSWLGGGTTYSIATAAAVPLETNPAASASQVVGVVTDPLGQKTTYTLDPLGRLLELQTPDGATELTQDEDSLQHFTTYTYNSQGDLLTVTDALGQVTSYTWSAGLEQTVTDPLGHTTSFQFDTDRRLSVTIDPLGDRATWTYDAYGDPYTYTDALGRVTTMVSDALGREVELLDANGGVTSWTYNSLDEVTAETGPLGDQTTFSYDGHGWLTAVTEAAGTSVQQTSTLIYDLAGRVLAVTVGIANANAHVVTTSYAYDPLGRTTQVIDAYGTSSQRTTSYAYRSFAATEELNRTALSLPGIKELVPPARVDHATRKEQRRAVLYRQACRENQRGSPLFRPGDPARPSADGWPRLLFDLAVLQEDRPQFALAA